MESNLIGDKSIDNKLHYSYVKASVVHNTLMKNIKSISASKSISYRVFYFTGTPLKS